MNDYEAKLFHIIFWYLTFSGIVIQLFGQKILEKLQANDNLEKMVKPRLFGAVWLFCNEAVCIVIICLAICVNSLSYAVIFSLLCLLHGLYMSSLLSTRLEYDEQYLSYKTLLKKRSVRIEDIRQVRRTFRSRSFGYTLEIYFCDREKIALPLMYFVGLNHLWNTLGSGQ